MRNKYLYISSEGTSNSNHSDFEVSFPEVYEIAPKSEIRCVSCRINVPDNTIIISDKNNTFYLGLDYWIKQNSSIPLLPIVIQNNAFDLTEGTSVLDFNQAVQKAINKAISHYCFVRGGLDVSISNQTLKFTASQMQMYGTPEQAIPDDVYNNVYVPYINYGSTVLQYENDIYWPLQNYERSQIPYDNTYYGLKFNKPNNEYSYFTSPRAIQGLVNYNIDDSGNSKANAPVTAVMVFDLRNNPFGATDELIITKGFTEHVDFGNNTQLNWGVFDSDGNQPFVLVFTNNNIILKLKDQSIIYTNTENYNQTSLFRIICREYEDNLNSYYNLQILVSADGTTWNDIETGREIKKDISFIGQTITNVNIKNKNLAEHERWAVSVKYYDQIDNFMYFAYALDDPFDKYGWNRHASQFGSRSKLNLDLSRPMSFVSDMNNANTSGGQTNRIEKDFLDLFKANLDNRSLDSTDEYLDYYQLPSLYLPSALDLGFEDDGLNITGIGDEDTYDTLGGITLANNVVTNSRVFPQFYLCLPDLPLENYSCNPLDGKKVQFVCPIDLNPSATHNRLYTSQLYTNNYNKMSNSHPLSLTTLKVKICDIQGRAVKGLDPYTICTLEIREPKSKEIKIMPSGQFDQGLKIIDNQ